MSASVLSRFSRLCRRCFVAMAMLTAVFTGHRVAAQVPAQPATASANSVAAAAAPAPVSFDEFFVDKALRLEMYQTGDARDEIVTLHRVCAEPIWPENPRPLASFTCSQSLALCACGP
jgi:hypothetical protein